MHHLKLMTADDRARFENTIDDVFDVVRDVIEHPSVLDRLPEQANLSLTRRGASGDGELSSAHVLTPRLIVDVQPRRDSDRRQDSARTDVRTSTTEDFRTSPAQNPVRVKAAHGKRASDRLAARDSEAARKRVSAIKRVKRMLAASRK